MPVLEFLKRSFYKDSLTLMRLAEGLAGRPGVRRATLLMGSEANKKILAAGGLLGEALAAAGPDDLMVAIEAAAPDGFERLRAEVDAALAGEAQRSTDGERTVQPPRSLAAARARMEEANLALVSVPGPYAAAEATKALRAKLNVFLFSDNVAIEDERRIKRLAERKGLMVMGPDCGTAIIQGVPLGFANRVRRGAIGIVGASGTGIQEVASQIHRLGGGISEAIGTGGRDLHDRIGGLTTGAALRLLAKDPRTEIVVLLSKPPAPSVATKVEEWLRSLGKPAVVLFLGAEATPGAGSLHRVEDLEAAARAAVALSGRSLPAERGEEAALASGEHARYSAGQRYLRGLYSGGTFAYEAQIVWRRHGCEVHSNAPLDPRLALADARVSLGHAAVDLGADEFTTGRPHPMIDPSYRIERLIEEARDPETAAIVLDLVLGTGAHADPASALAPAIGAAREVAAAEGRHLTVIAFLCGTEDDPQGYARQESSLGAAGALVAKGSTAAARLAALCLDGSGPKPR